MTFGKLTHYEELTTIGDAYEKIRHLDSKARTRAIDWLIAKLEEDRDKEALQPQGASKP